MGLFDWLFAPKGTAGRYTVWGWALDNVGPGATQDYMGFAGSTTGSAFPGYWIALRKGSVTGVCVKSINPITAGSLTVEVFRNSQPLNPQFTAQLNPTSPLFKATTIAPGTYPFASGDQLEIRVSSSSNLAPVTHVAASFEVES